MTSRASARTQPAIRLALGVSMIWRNVALPRLIPQSTAISAAPSGRPSASRTLYVRAGGTRVHRFQRDIHLHEGAAQLGRPASPGGGRCPAAAGRARPSRRTRARRPAASSSSAFGRRPRIDAARQAEDRAAMAHVREAEAAIAVGIDRRSPGIARRPAAHLSATLGGAPRLGRSLRAALAAWRGRPPLQSRLTPR